MTPQPTEPIEKVIAREIAERSDVLLATTGTEAAIERLVSKHLQPERDKFDQLLKIAEDLKQALAHSGVTLKTLQNTDFESSIDGSDVSTFYANTLLACDNFLTTLSPQNEGKKE
jgi:predicted Abi (CAAX) family protease